MRTPLALLAVVAATLGPVAAASAKEIASVKVCGAAGCRDVTDRATTAIVDGGPPTTPPGAAAPFFRVKVTMKAEGGQDVPGWTNLWVPSAGLLRGDDGTWMSPASTTVDALNRLVSGIRPLPAGRLALPAPVAQPPAASAPAPSAPPEDGGLPTAVWAFIAAGALGVAFALARVAAAAVAARRGGSAPAG